MVVGRIGGPTCPVGLVEQLLAVGQYRTVPQGPGEDVGPLLQTVQHNAAGERLQRVSGTMTEPVPSMTYGAFRDRRRQMCEAAGIRRHITPRSLRIRGNSEAAERGVPEELSRAHGRWLAPQMVDLYTRRSVRSAIDLTRSLGLH